MFFVYIGNVTTAVVPTHISLAVIIVIIVVGLFVIIAIFMSVAIGLFICRHGRSKRYQIKPY